MNAKNLLRTAASFLLAAAFLYVAFRGVNGADLLRSLEAADYRWVLALIPLVLVGYWIRAVRWSYLLQPVKQDIKLRNLFSAIVIGYAVNNVLPRVGEFVRPMMLGRSEQISGSAVFGTVVVERILDIITFYFIAAIVLIVYPNALDPLVENPSAVRPYLVVVSVGAFAVFVLLFFQAEMLLNGVKRARWLFPKRFEERLESLLNSFIAGFGVAKKKEHLGIVASLSLLMWGVYALGIYIPFFAFDALHALQYDVGAAVLLLVITSIAWILPAPGALGTYHSFLTIALTKLYGVDPATALSFAIITHEVAYIIVMVLGAYYFFHDHISLSSVVNAENAPSVHPGEPLSKGNIL